MKGHEDTRPDKRSEAIREHAEPDPIRCAACGAAVTARRLAVERGGGHEHTFLNPAGIIYRIACYSDAPGCRSGGSPTAEFTWFPGYLWMYALCGACGTHLGWVYTSEGGDAFHGLIADRLAAEGSQA